MSPEPELVSVAHDGAVTMFTLARPPANALGMPLVEALGQAMDEFERRGSKVLVIGSALPGFFAAGADLKYISTLDADGFARYRDALRGPLERIAYCGRPSIAAIDGLAFGGGLELAMACSMRFVTPAARVGLPEIKLGLLPGAGGTQRLTRLIGSSRSLQMMLTGDEIDGVTAAQYGLAELVEAESALPAALKCAASIARWPEAAASAIIACVEAAVQTPTSGMEVEGEGVARLFADGHADAGISAFLERVK